jgi:hypothetical protein
MTHILHWGVAVDLLLEVQHLYVAQAGVLGSLLLLVYLFGCWFGVELVNIDVLVYVELSEIVVDDDDGVFTCFRLSYFIFRGVYRILRYAQLEI